MMHPSTTPLQPISGNQTRCSLSTTTNDSLRRHSAPKVIIPTKDPIRPKNPSSNPSFHHDFHRLDLPSRSRGSTELSGSTADPDKLLDHKTLRPTTSPPTRREQPLRSTKIMPSIEDAENQRISPAFGSQEFEAEWVPSEGAESNILSFGSSRSTSCQQSPSKPLSITRRKEAHSSSRSRLDPPSNERHRRSVKSELPDTETIYPGIEASVNYIASTPTRDFETQKQRLEEHGFFEWHEADVAFARMKQTEQEMEEKLAIEKAAYERLLERSRKDHPSRRSPGRLEGYCEPSKESKRAHTGFERKSQHKIFNQNGNDVDSPIVRTPNSLQGTHSLERDQVGHSGKSSQGCIDPQFEVSKVAASSSGTPVFNLAPDGPAHVRREFGHLSTRFSSGQPKGSGLASMGGPRPDKLRQSLDSRFPHLKRREVEVPLDKCKCDELHWYFAEPGLQFPDKDSFCGSIQEFLAHASQVADCGAHDPVLVDNCRQIIMSETYCSCAPSSNKDVRDDKVLVHTGVGSVGNCPSSDTNHPSSSDRDRATRFEADASWTSLSTKQAARLRNQSSIEPSQFYGRPPVFKHPPKVHLQARSSNEFSGAIPAKGDVCFTGKDFEVSMPSHQHSSETKSLNEVGDTTASTDPTSRLPDPLCTILARPVREKNSVREPFQPSQDHRVAMLPVPASVMLKRRKHWQPRDHQKKDAAENAEVMEFAKPPLKFSPSRPSKRQKHIHQSDDRHTDNSTSHSMEAPVIVSVGTRPSTPLSAPLYQNRQPSGGVLDDHFTPLQDSFNDNDSSKEQPNTAVDIVPSVPRQLSLTTRQSKRRRYQSMPAASSIAADIVNGTDEETQLTRSSVGQLGLHGLFSSARISLLQDVGHVLDEKFREFRSSLIAPVDQAPNPPIPPVAPITPATPATPAPNVPDTPRTKRRRQNEVWNRSHPAITTPVPENEKLTDSALIEVGKKVDPYDRHCAAPYAFSRRGALKIKEYKHLLTYRHEDGSPGWTAKEMVRLTH